MGNYADNRQKGESLLGFPNDYVIIDIETTGLDPKINKIIELGAVKYKDFEEVDRFSSFIKIDEPLDSFISNLTGITDEMLATGPAIDIALKQFIDFVGDDILVGHNIHFDINFIYDNCIKYLDHTFNNDFVDTLRLSRKYILDIDNHKLSTICKHFNIDNLQEHRSIGDILATNECYLKLHELSKEFNKQYIVNNIELNNKLFKNKKCRVKGRFETLDNSVVEDLIEMTSGKVYHAFYDFIDCLILSKRIYSAYLDDNKEPSAVIKKARQLAKEGKLTVMSEAEFCKLFNIEISEKSHSNKHLQAKDITATTDYFDETHPVYNKCFCFTGALSKITRKEAMQFVVDLGGICGDGVTKKTNFLVLGNNDYCKAIIDGKSTKHKKAEKLILDGQDLQIISEDVFFDLVLTK